MSYGIDLTPYVQDAIRTESVIDETKPVNRKGLISALIGAHAAGNALDLLKKEIFYGKAASREDLELHGRMCGSSLYELTEQYSEVNAQQVPLDFDPRLLHGVIGLATESSELVAALLSPLIEKKPLDKGNLVEELGDLCWYLALIIDSQGLSFNDLLNRNIEKLKKRYPEKFSSERANNRDLKTEQECFDSK